MTPDPPRSRLVTTAWIAAIVAACALRWVYPGNVPWNADEAQLITFALDANAAGRLAPRGITGSKGVNYGPLPAWIYQVFVAATHDPIKMVVARAALVSAVTALSLIWLSRTLGLHRWYVIALLLSPYLWYYSRTLWDNSFNIPLCALATAAYVDFLHRRRVGSLLLALGCLPLMLMIHLMAIPFVAAMLLHLLLLRRADLWRYRGQVLALLIAAVIVSFPYWSRWRLIDPVAESGRPVLRGWLFALLGARPMTGTGFGGFFSDAWWKAMPTPLIAAFRTAAAVTAIFYGLTWIGLIITTRRWIALRRRLADATLRNQTALLCAGIIALQLMINGLTATYGRPQYYNATWIAFALLAWLMLGRMRSSFAHGLTTAHAVAATVIIVIVLIHNDTTAGTRDPGHGPAMAEQLRIARELARYDPASTLVNEVPFFDYAPICLLALDRLVEHPADPLPATTLVLQYASDDPADARLKLIPQQ